MNLTIEECYKKAMEVMYENITPLGFSASSEKSENYYAVWGRDHSITSIGAVLTGDKRLIDTAKKGILTLLRYQKDYGQIPSYIEIEKRKRVYGGLGAITSVDSNMWVVIAAAWLYKHTKDKRFIKEKNLIKYKQFYNLFKGFDSNDCGLIEVPKAGDWADIFNRTYHVLYDECLYYEALKALLYLFREASDKFDENNSFKKNIDKNIKWIRKRKAYTKRKINNNLWFSKDNIDKIREEYMIFDELEIKDYHYYQSHLMPFKHDWENRFDGFGNVIAMATGVADWKKKKSIINYVLKNGINEPVALTSLNPPVLKNEKGWEPIYEKREKPYTYHNGGIWPVITGFWIYCLSKNNCKKKAKAELFKFSELMKEDGWRFNEYYHGKNLKPMGKKFQAWSASGYIIAYTSLSRRVNIFDF
ncbi:MAG: amylo-alpha-1,6-glucosidase [Nanobdellota archaeon]